MRDQLFDWMEANTLAITEDGHIIAYKYVRSDYFDCHTGTILHEVGSPTPIEMPREMVDDDPTNLCSAGLHCCSERYLPNYGGGSPRRLLMMKVNPADVVSVPIGYDGKMRVCRYWAIQELDWDDYSEGDHTRLAVVDL